MLFSSVTFLFFFLPLVLAGNRWLPQKMRPAFLLIASLLFYTWGEIRALPVMLVCILATYLAGQGMGRYPEKKKLMFISVIVLHLSMLGYFKYAKMFVPGANIVLPLGISFYTFQAMSYCVDVYKGKQQPGRFVPFALYITFFPQLIAGPIERYSDVEEGLAHPQTLWPDLAEGARLFAIGLGKKLLIANPMGEVWSALSLMPQMNGVVGNWLSLMAFAFQIYFDFSGYSDMARGLGRMMGVPLSRNFNYPYTAKSITDFWRRWHITLSSWFRDHVYIPLGGNRKGLKRQLINILIVWALTGLWHGASLNFLCWGVYYALLLVMEKCFLLKWYEKLPRGMQWLRHGITLLLVLVGWCIFAFDDFGMLLSFLAGLFSGSGWMGREAGAVLVKCLPLMAVAALACIPWKVKLPKAVENGALVLLLVLCVAALAAQSYNPFLYFRF